MVGNETYPLTRKREEGWVKMGNLWSEGDFSILVQDHLAGLNYWRREHGYVRGEFGIHQTGKYGFPITHIPTGRQVAFETSLKRAIKVAEGLMSIKKVDWSKKEVGYYRGLPDEVLKKINEVREKRS